MPTGERPLLVCLPFLGGTTESWHAVAGRLGAVCDCHPVDLPGFGEAAGVGGYSVGAMADHVAAIMRDRAPGRWFVAGHSMGAKVACVLARRAEDGSAELAGLGGLILLSGSPPGPEPMEDDQRQTMTGWFQGDAASRRAQAQGYIDANIGAPLPPGTSGRVVDGVLRANRDAWVAWLDRGSREDWSERVGVLQTPTLIVTGSKDASLGAAIQRQVSLPHFARARMVDLPGAGHLLPMERPGEVARLIAAQIAPAPHIADGYRALIASDRVSSGTRAALMSRAAADDPAYIPAVLSPRQIGTLRAVLDRVLPQPGPGCIDLAARIDTALAGPGDGWRFAALPSDAVAWGAGLDTLSAAGFDGLDTAAQDALLTRVAAGHCRGALSHGQMRMWFEDLRAEAARAYVAHPATLARMAYSGIGYGGDGEPKPGFVHIGVGEREAWEPS